MNHCRHCYYVISLLSFVLAAVSASALGGPSKQCRHKERVEITQKTSLIAAPGSKRTAFLVANALRGGVLFFRTNRNDENVKKRSRRRKKSNAKIYRESLEEQVLLLDSQLRQARSEIVILRDRMKKQIEYDKVQRRRDNLLNRKHQRQKQKTDQKQREDAKKQESRRQQQIKDELRQLEDEVRSLEKMKLELEALVETSGKKIFELEQQLASMEETNATLEESLRKQIETLEAQLRDIQTKQLDKLKEIHQKKIDEAVDKAIKTQQAEFQRILSETTKRLNKEHAKAMELEKLRSFEAVEAERKKMRKLVRALAWREKKLQSQEKRASEENLQTKSQFSSTPDDSDGDDKEEKEKFKAKTNIKSASSFKPLVPPTTRGKI